MMTMMILQMVVMMRIIPLPHIDAGKIFHCPGGFQPGKMKAEERWRPAGQKKEPQVRQNYLDSFFLSVVGNLDVKIIILILRLRWALGAP